MLSFPRLSLLSVAISSFFLIVQASGHGPNSQNHRRRNMALRSNFTLETRDENTGDFTWFVDGLGACGATNTASDYIVALNIPQWDSGSHCFEMVTLSYGGKSVQAQITDQCGNCASGSLDLSYGLFSYLIGDPNTIGDVSGSWSFGSDSGSSTTTTSSSTSQYTPPSTTQTPTSTYTPPPSTSSTSTSTSISTSISTSTSSLSMTSSSSSSNSSSSTTAPTTSTSSSTSASTTASAGPQVLSHFQVVLLQLAGLSAGIYVEN